MIMLRWDSSEHLGMVVAWTIVRPFGFGGC